MNRFFQWLSDGIAEAIASGFERGATTGIARVTTLTPTLPVIDVEPKPNVEAIEDTASKGKSKRKGK